MKLVKLSCPSCGAPLNLSTTTSVLLCPFCDTRTVLTDGQEQVQLAPSLVAPFKVGRERFELALLEFLAEGDYTPDDIFQKAMVTDRAGVYLPFYELQGEFRATFTASAGYDRKEKTHYVERDAKGREKRRTRTKTVTDWRPMSGEASAPYCLWQCASHSIADSLRDWAQEEAARSGSSLEELREDHVGAYVLEDFGFSGDEAMNKGGRDQLKARVKGVCRARVPGDKCKDLKVDFTTRDEKSRAIQVAFWLATFRYGKQSFAVGVSGRDAQRVHGNRPVDQERQERVKALSLPFKIAAGVSLFVFVIGLCFGGIPSVAAVLFGLPVTLLLGWRGKKAQTEILEHSKKVRAEVLERLKRGGSAQSD